MFPGFKDYLPLVAETQDTWESNEAPAHAPGPLDFSATLLPFNASISLLNSPPALHRPPPDPISLSSSIPAMASLSRAQFPICNDILAEGTSTFPPPPPSDFPQITQSLVRLPLALTIRHNYYILCSHAAFILHIDMVSALCSSLNAVHREADSVPLDILRL